MYDGACYHVINRGNYREWIFKEDSTKEMFEKCLDEAANKMGWVLHGWVVMGNHYHLALETPLGNLSQGMQWLQVTFSARFNAFRQEHGHVFQGRYKAILVEPGKALGRVCHYIDLNPVRAGICSVGQLQGYRFGSYYRLHHRSLRPDWYESKTALTTAAQLADTKKGLASYADYLQWLTEEIKAGKEKDFLQLSKGLAIGSEGFVQDVQVRLEQTSASERNLDALGRRQLREREWSARLRKMMKDLTKTTLSDDRVSAAWKAKLAWRMKSETDVSNGWLAQALHMGSATYVSKQVGLVRRSAG